MSSGLVKLVFFAEIKDYFTTVFERVPEVDKVKQKAADGVEDNVLRERLVNAHGLLLTSL